MKTRDTIILLVVVAVCGLFIFLYERNLPTTGEKEERQGRILSLLDIEKVTRIALEGPEHTTVIVREGSTDEWKLTSPVQAEADAAMVDGLLSDLEFLESDRKVPKATSAQRKSFGLVTPSVEVEVEMKGATLRFVLGAEAEAGGVYLALDGDDTVYVVETMSVESLRRKPSEFREKRLLGRTAGGLTDLRVTHQDGTTVRLVSTARGWELNVGDGGAERASQKAADQVTRSLASLRALEFLEDGVKEHERGKKGFASTPPTVSYTREDGVKGSLAFGESCGPRHDDAAVKALVMPGGILVCVGQAARDAILTPVEELRLASPVEVDAFEVQSIEAQRAGKVTMRVEREGESAWIITAPGEPAAAEPVAVEALIDTLNRSRSTGYAPLPADLATVGLDPLGGTELTIIDVAGQQVEHLWLGARPDGTFTFRREGESVYATLGADPVLATAHEAWALFSRTVVSRDYFEAVRFSVEGQLAHELVKKEGAWAFVVPEGMPADAADVRDTVETACGLEAVRFIAAATPEALEANGLARPAFEIEVSFEKDGVPADPAVPDVVRILVGNETEDGRAAFVEGASAIFVLSGQVALRLTRPLADRGALAAVTADAASITLTRGAAQETFTVSAGKVSAHASGQPGLFDLADVQAFFASLVTLRASWVASYGPPPPAAGLASAVLTITVAPASAQAEPATMRFGTRFTPKTEEMFHARVGGVDATFGVDVALVEPLL